MSGHVGTGLLGIVLVVASGAAAAGDRGEVHLRLFQFQPARLEVVTGARVIWINDDQIAHTVTAGTPERPVGGPNVRLPERGARAEWQFHEAGVFPIFCARHPHMQAEIVVTPGRRQQ